VAVQTMAIFSLGVRAVFTTAATATSAIFMGDLAGWAQARGERRVRSTQGDRGPQRPGTSS
jgi:hypothetical protein